MKSYNIILCAINLIGLTANAGIQQFHSPLPTHKTQAEDFFYAQQTSLWIFFKTPKDSIIQQIGGILDKLGFDLVSFEDPSVGYIIIKPMVFMAEFGFQDAAVPGTSASTEVELTVLVRPKSSTIKLTGSFEGFLKGKDKSNEIGQLRLDVLCDNEIAVAAGRRNFGEHKFLGSFVYKYRTPNNQLAKTPPFSFELSAYTWKGAPQVEQKMFQIQVNLKGLAPTSTRFTPELLFSAFPPEPQPEVLQKPVGEYRYYNNSNFRVFITSKIADTFKINFGEAKGAERLSPAPPFGDGKAIPGSENWPRDMVRLMKELVNPENVAGYLLYRSPPAEYETRPFEI